MAMSKGFRIFEKKTPNHSIILEHRNRTNEALLFESQAIAVLCKLIYKMIHIFPPTFRSHISAIMKKLNFY